MLKFREWFKRILDDLSTKGLEEDDKRKPPSSPKLRDDKMSLRREKELASSGGPAGTVAPIRSRGQQGPTPSTAPMPPSRTLSPTSISTSAMQSSTPISPSRASTPPPSPPSQPKESARRESLDDGSKRVAPPPAQGQTRSIFNSIYEILNVLPREQELAIYIPVKLPVGYTRLAREATRAWASRVNILAKIEPGKYIIICRANNRGCAEVFTALRDNRYLQTARVGISRYSKSDYSEVSIAIAAHNDDVPIRLFIDSVNPNAIYSLGSCNGIRDYKKCIPMQRGGK